MKYISMNIRGIGGSHKAEWVKEVYRDHNARFVAIQETHIVDPSKINVNNYWNKFPLDYEAVPSQGRSGGLLSYWDASLFSKTSCVTRSNFLIISGKLRGIDSIIHVANVYAPSNAGRRNVVWTDLDSVILHVTSVPHRLERRTNPSL